MYLLGLLCLIFFPAPNQKTSMRFQRFCQTAKLKDAPPSPIRNVQITMTENGKIVKSQELDSIIKKFQQEILKQYKQLKSSTHIVEDSDNSEESMDREVAT